MTQNFYLKRVFFALLFCCSFSAGFAQVVVTTPDTVICPNTSAVLHATLTGRNGTSVSLTDDWFTGVIPLGFSFNYYGNVYTKCVFSSNGYISFDTSRANSFSAWSISSGIPGNTDVLNSIMGHYADIYPPAGGTLDYCTVGTAPNRKFVISFCDAAMFSCTSMKTSFQIILYETTNNIEVHLGAKPVCTTWNSGAGIEGVQNATGSDAVVVPGRNYPTQWTAAYSAHKFTPTVNGSGAATYNLSSIPYSTIPNANATVSWYANGTTFVGSGLSVTVSPTTTTFYVARAINCSDTLADTVLVTVGPTGPGGIGPNIDSVNKTDPSWCGNNDGVIRIYGLTPNTIHTVFFSKNAVAVTPFNMTSNAQGVITVTGLTAGVYSNIKVKKGICESNIVGPLTLNEPPLTVDYNFSIDYGCNGDTVHFTNLTGGGGPTYAWKWDFADGNGDTAKNPTHKFLSQGTYNVKLVAGNGVCKDSAIKPVALVHPLAASFIVSADSICQKSQSVIFTNTSTATTPTFAWDFGDGNTDNNENPAHSYLNAGVYNVRLIVTDFVPCLDTAYHTIVVDSIPYVNFITSADEVCEGQGIQFTGDYLGIGNTGISWDFGDGTTIPNTNPISHAFEPAGTYTIKLTAKYRICPDTSFSKSITIKPFPVIDLGPDTTICPNGDPLSIHDLGPNAANPNASYVWNTGATGSAITVNAPGTFTSTVTVDGCSASDEVKVLKDCYIDIPNSFTPNNDGLNDYFFPRQFLSRSVTSFKMQVYNRWGQIIFETTNIDGRGWDGKYNDKDQPSGVYVYLMDVSFANGTKEHYQGNVTLIR